MSSFGLAPATVAAALVPSANRTEMAPPPATTWWAVRIVPVSVTTVPDPREPLVVVMRTTDGTTCRYRSVTGSGVAVAAGVGGGVARSAAVGDVDPSRKASAAMTTMATTSTPAATISHRQPGWGRVVEAGSAGPGSSVPSGATADRPAATSSAWGARNPRTRPAPAGSMETSLETVPRNRLWSSGRLLRRLLR